MMASTVSQIFAEMSPEQRKVQNIQGLIASLVFGRFTGDGCSVSRGGRFTDKDIQECQDFRDKTSDVKSLRSKGFGYFDSEHARIKASGFLEGEKIAVVVRNDQHNSTEPLAQDIVDEYGQTMVAHFSAMHIRCLSIQGGTYPDRLGGIAVIFDINDPEFLQKIKPDFMAVFTAREARQLESNHAYNDEDRQQYTIELVRLLLNYAKENEFDLGLEITEQSNETKDNVLSMAKHKLEMFVDGLDAMLPVLSTEERKTLMIDVLDRFVSQAPNNREFTHIRKLALG